MIMNEIEKTGIGNRRKIKVLDSETETWESYTAEYNYVDGVTYSVGKNKNSVVVGDLVKIGDEEFYTVKHIGEDVLLLAHYNLKVGKSFAFDPLKEMGEYKESDEGYGLQSSEAVGSNGNGNSFGVLPFCEASYWNGKVGDGKKYPGSYTKPNNPYVYDENSVLYPYLQNYAKKLKTKIKEIRLLSYQEYIELGCNQSSNSCANAYDFIKHVGISWTGSANNNTTVYYYSGNTDKLNYITCINYVGYGLRPAIII